MIKMHNNELEINEHLVHLLLKSQCPHWAHLTTKPIASSGTDNALFRLGDDYVVRLPRVEWTAGGVTKNINKEYEWIPKLANLLKTPISNPLFKGNPDKLYPWPWLITTWNEGDNPNYEQENEHKLLAKDLAFFLNELHQSTLMNGPHSRRGVALTEQDTKTKKAITQLENELNSKSVTSLWDKLSNIPTWNKNPVWIHGDFLPGNILVQNNRLNAVIDFSDVGIGDPACDLIIAWSLFKPHSRKIFRNNLENIDDDTWQRGKGWALSIALIMLPYYKYSNPALASLATRIIENVLNDS